MDLPPGSLGVFLILALWVVLIFMALAISFFPHVGEHRRGKKKVKKEVSEHSAS